MKLSADDDDFWAYGTSAVLDKYLKRIEASSRPSEPKTETSLLRRAWRSSKNNLPVAAGSFVAGAILMTGLFRGWGLAALVFYIAFVAAYVVASIVWLVSSLKPISLPPTMTLVVRPQQTTSFAPEAVAAETLKWTRRNTYVTIIGAVLLIIMTFVGVVFGEWLRSQRH